MGKWLVALLASKDNPSAEERGWAVGTEGLPFPPLILSQGQRNPEQRVLLGDLELDFGLGLRRDEIRN